MLEGVVQKEQEEQAGSSRVMVGALEYSGAQQQVGKEQQHGHKQQKQDRCRSSRAREGALRQKQRKEAREYQAGI